MADPAVTKAIQAIIGEHPGIGDGLAAFDPQEDFLEDVGRLTLIRSFTGDDIPSGYDPGPDGIVHHTYHFYFSTSALSLVDLARRIDPAREGLEGVWYIEVGNARDSLSGTFSYTESGSDGGPSYAMMRDLAFLYMVIGGILGSDTVRLASFAGTKAPPVSGDFDLVTEIISLLEDLGKIISKNTEKLGKALKITPKLWDPKERTDDLRKVIDGAAKSLKTVATTFKSGIDLMVGLALEAVDGTLSTIEAVLEGGAETVIDFFAEQLGSHAAPLVAAKELAKLVLRVIGTLRDKIAELRAFGQRAADWFNRSFGELKESFDVLIGYFSGVWNGLVDAVLGIFDTINLVVTILLGAFRLSTVAQDAWDLSLEIIDEILQGLSEADLIDMWDTFAEDIYPEMRDTLSKHGRMLSDAIGHTLTSNNAAVGYYLGYVVYTIAEMFFPPIKLTKVARAARSSAAGAKAFLTRLSKFNGI